jgi:multidrug efflux system membrane fusion protein
MDQTQSPSSWPRRAWRALPVVAVLAGAGWFGLRSPAATPRANAAPAAVPATLVKVAREDVARYLSGVGTVQPLASVTVKSRIDGQLERVDYTEGQDVKAGQVLAQLDARPLRAQLEQMQAQKARDAAQLANARLDLERYMRLMQDEATSQQTLDTQRAQVAQLEAALRNDDAQIHYAQVQLGYTTITAPLSGRVGAKLVDPGNIVHAVDATGLVVINQIDPVAVSFTLPDDAVQAVERARRDGRKLQVLAYSKQGDKLLAQGELVLVNNQIDTASGTVQLKARFANPEHLLWPGQYVNMRLRLGELPQALTVPAPVVQRGPGGTYAYVVGADGKAQMRSIQVQQVQDGKAVIAAGLQAGETVVLDGQYKLRPGLAVVAASAPTRVASREGSGS